MSRSTIYSLLAATPFGVVAVVPDRGIAPADPRAVVAKRIVAFRTEPIAPAAAHAFEVELQRLLREIGRVILQWVFNRLEPEQADQAPLWFNFEGNLYRRRERSPRRLGVGTLFGTITLERIRYEPADGGVGLLSVFPLEMRLGIVVGKATLGLAERVGKWTAQYTQEIVRGNGCTRSIRIAWSVTTLRARWLCASSPAALPRFDPASPVSWNVCWGCCKRPTPKQGAASSGFVGGPRRDIRTDFQGHPVHAKPGRLRWRYWDRSGKRFGHVYLGQMPEPGQGTLSQQLTGFVNRGSPALGRPIAPIAIRDRRQPSP